MSGSITIATDDIDALKAVVTETEKIFESEDHSKEARASFQKQLDAIKTAIAWAEAQHK